MSMKPRAGAGPRRKATKSGFFWAVVSDDRGHGGADPPIVLFHYAPAGAKNIR
ncbi:insertion sequence transposase protein (plasmid) [Frigidibacter mobilis]|uniref:Insertion sequence transposase protein n=1 Tax=Frigidibacter mobilis TaxID=1335048 RepID=A0A159ZB02_9RHOB|nr:hypothetical protein [Frigidibacter mobilis]AMY72158.1 insertion sequence transposase protein [Frigidibacter mobilis]